MFDETPDISLNERTIDVKLRRGELIDAIIAINSVISVIAGRSAIIQDPETTRTFRDECRFAIDNRWNPLRDKLEQQLGAYNASRMK